MNTVPGLGPRKGHYSVPDHADNMGVYDATKGKNDLVVGQSHGRKYIDHSGTNALNRREGGTQRSLQEVVAGSGGRG